MLQQEILTNPRARCCSSPTYAQCESDTTHKQGAASQGNSWIWTSLTRDRIIAVCYSHCTRLYQWQ